jgi:hypothetical protein
MEVAKSHTVWGLLIVCATFGVPMGFGVPVETLESVGKILMPIFTAFFVYRGSKMGINGGGK